MAASTMHPLAQARSATAPPATLQHRGIPVWRHIGATPAASRQEPRASVVIAGAGPVGLAMALDLARRGHAVVVISRLDFVPGGSKAICFSKRSLDIFERLGVGQTLLDKGVTWNVGKVFWGARAEPIYQFDMLPIKDQQYPGFINIQQYYVAEALLEALRALPHVQLRLGQNIESLQVLADHVRLGVQAGAQHYTQEADWLIACDGSKSTLRGLMGLDFNGRVFEENFLIADIRMPQERPAERWFWFDPPFNPGQSALMHRQPDGLWRLDFQLGWGIDREACAQPENVERYVRAMLGPGVGQYLHLPMPPHGPLCPWPRAVCRRQRPPGIALWGARLQWRPGRYRQPGLEARPGAARGIGAGAAGELQRRGHCDGR